MSPFPTITALLAVLLCAAYGGKLLAQAPAPLVLERTIPLKGVSGRIDHMAIDLRHNRLFVAELGNGTVDAILLASGEVIHRIEGLKEPQGVGYIPDADVIAVACAADGTVRLFRAGDFSPIGTISLGEDADNVRLDPGSGHLFVGYGEGGLAVLDPTDASILARIKLPAHPEGFQLDRGAQRAIVNVPDARQIAVVDTETGKQVVTWRVPGLRANFPMALDDTGTVIASVFRDPPKLVLLDANDGSLRASVETCGDANDVFFDAKRQRLYISCGEGAVDVLQQEPGGYRRVDRIETSSGARTSLFVPELDLLFVAARAGFLGLGSEAAVLVFRPLP